MIPEEKNPKVLSTEELLARFNAQKAGTLSAVNKNLDPWGSELVDIDSMLGDQKEPTVPQTKPVAQGAGPETEKKQGIFPYLGKKLASSVMGLGEMVMETPQAIEALSNAPAVMLTEAMIKRKLRKGEIDQETGSYLMKEAATITPRRTITGNMVNTDTMPGEVLAEGDLNTWFESNKDKFSNAATRYDQTATEYLKSGQFGKALGAVAGGVAESAAPTLAAMFIPGGAAALGIGVGSQSYDDVKDREDMAEGMKIADAVTTGVFEWLFERFGSREMGKALMEIYQKAGKKGVRNAFTSPGMQNLIGKAYKKFGVWFAPVHEGISEGLTTLGQNAAAIVSGEDPERDIADGFWDSVLIGAGMGGMFSMVEKAAEKHKIYREGKAGPVIEPLTVEEQDPEQMIRDLGRKYAYNGFNDQLPEQNFVKYGEMKDGRKVIIKSTNFATDPEQMLVTVVDAENPESKTEMVKGTMIVNSMDVPYEEWVANEMKNYQATKAEINNQVAKASAPVQEGATIPIGEQLFNVTQVTPEGITLNEIDKEGNLTANTQVITPDQYGEVFGMPAEQTSPIPQPETPAAQIQPEMQPQAEQPVAEQGQPATTATVSPQSRKVSDGKNEFTILPQEDGNFRMSETFQTQKQAESTIKKLQELYPKLTWETEVTDSGDYFTPDTYSIVAKVPQKKAPKAPKVEPVKAEEKPAPASSIIDVTNVPTTESSDNDLAEKQDYQLSSDNVTDATYDIKRGIGLEPGSRDLISGYTRIGDAIIRIKDHAPNWENFREDIEERGVKKIVNITVGNYPSPNFREHDKTAMEAIEAEYPDVEFVNIEIEDGESIAEAIKQAQQAIQQPIAEQTTVQPPSTPDETAAEEEVQKAGKVEKHDNRGGLRQKLPDEIKQEAIKLYQAGLSQDQVSKELNIGDSTVSKILAEFGIEARKFESLHNKKPQELKDEVIRLYADENLGMNELSERFNIGTTTIARWLKEAGVTRNLSEAFAISAEKGRKKYRGTNLPWQSSKTNRWEFADSKWELVRMSQLDADEEVKSWTKLVGPVPYVDPNGVKRNYSPDFIIEYNDGHKVVEEIKPKAQKDNEINKIKSEAAQKYFNDRGIEYRIVTEDELGVEDINNFNIEGFASITEEERAKRRLERRAKDSKR